MHSQTVCCFQELRAAIEEGRQVGRAHALGNVQVGSNAADHQSRSAENGGNPDVQGLSNNGQFSEDQEVCSSSSSSSSSSSRGGGVTGKRESDTAPASVKGGRQAKQQQQQQQQQQQRLLVKKEKVKEVFFGPKIAGHDIEVRLKRARQWLSEGRK